MQGQCIICGNKVTVTGSPEIIACEDATCIMTVENSIGLHYQSGKAIPLSEHFSVIPPVNFNGSIHIIHP